MLPNILMMQRPKHSKGGGERSSSYREMQKAQQALDDAKKVAETGRLPDGSFASLDDRNMTESRTNSLTRKEIIYFKATVETVTRLVGYTRDEIRQCKSRVRRAELEERLERQEAVIAAAKAELELRRDFLKCEIVSVEICGTNDN